MGAISNEDGGDLDDEYYGGTYKTKFDYRVGTNPRQVVSGITQNVWGKTFFYFIGDPDGSGNMSLGVFPGEYSAFTGANRIAIEPFHLAVELNAIEELDSDGDGIPDTVDIDDNETDDYTATFSLSEAVDITTIYIANRDGGTVNLTFSPDGNNDDDIIELTDSNGVTVDLNWRDVSNFTITGDIEYNLIIEDIKFREGGLPGVDPNDDYHAPNRYIAVGQGFFVSASALGGEVRFENSMRNFETDIYTDPDNDGSGTGTYFFKNNSKKATQNDANDQLPVLKLGFNYKGSNQIALHRQIGISFRNGNTFDFDNGYDSEIIDIGSTDFYWYFPDYLDKRLIIAGITGIKDNLEVPLTVVVENNNPFSIEIDHIRNINRDLFIIDKLTNISYKLSKDSPIELSLPKGNYLNRFYLTFKKSKNTSLNLEDNILNKELYIYLNNETKEIVIQNKSNILIDKVEIFNILGQKIKSWKKIENTSINNLSIKKLTTSFYIVKVKTKKGNISKKLFLNTIK